MKIQIIISFLLFPFSIFSQKNSYTQIARQDDILFESGKFELSSANKILLDSTILILNKDNQYRLKLTAHTDADGSAKSNLILSHKRSNAVKSYFLERGFEEKNIEIIDYGESKLLSKKEDETSKQRNRRVTIEIIKYLPLVKINGKVKDKTGAIPNAKIYLSSDGYSDSTTSRYDGSYEISAPENLPARMSVIAKNHIFFSKNLNASFGGSLSNDFNIEIANLGEIVVINDLYFFGDESRLLPKSIPALKDLKLFLEMNPNYKIEIMGHCNYPGNKLVDSNSRYYKLAEDRAKLVMDNLIEQKIDRNRLHYKGYGNSKMKFINPKNEQEEEANRRVEIKIIEE